MFLCARIRLRYMVIWPQFIDEGNSVRVVSTRQENYNAPAKVVVDPMHPGYPNTTSCRSLLSIARGGNPRGCTKKHLTYTYAQCTRASYHFIRALDDTHTHSITDNV